MVAPWKACTYCKGTGKRGNGKCSRCKYHRDSRHGSDYAPGYQPGMVPDYDNRYDGGVCESCEGSTLQPGDGNAWLEPDMLALVMADVPIKATVSSAELSWMEQHLGHRREENEALSIRNLYTVVDHGTRFRQLQAVVAADGDLMAAVEAIRVEESADLARHFSNVCGLAEKITTDRWRVFTEVHYQITGNGLRCLLVFDKSTKEDV
jgi:hypothetical protein